MATQCTNIRIIAQKFFIGLDTSNCQKFWPTYRERRQFLYIKDADVINFPLWKQLKKCNI